MPGITTYNAVKDSADELKNALLNFMDTSGGQSAPKAWSVALWEDFDQKARAFQTQCKDFNVRKKMHRVNREKTQDLLVMAQALVESMAIYCTVAKKIDELEDLPGYPQTAPFSDSVFGEVKFKMLKDPATLDSGIKDKITGAGIPIGADVEYLLHDLIDLGILDDLVKDGFVPAGAQKNQKIKAILKENDVPDALAVMRGVSITLGQFNVAMLKSRVVWE